LEQSFTGKKALRITKNIFSASVGETDRKNIPIPAGLGLVNHPLGLGSTAVLSFGDTVTLGAFEFDYTPKPGEKCIQTGVLGNCLLKILNVTTEYSAGNFSFSSAEATGFSTTAIPVSVVPVPAAAWLFGSGLIGLIGVARRKKA